MMKANRLIILVPLILFLFTQITVFSSEDERFVTEQDLNELFTNLGDLSEIDSIIDESNARNIVDLTHSSLGSLSNVLKKDPTSKPSLHKEAFDVLCSRIYEIGTSDHFNEITENNVGEFSKYCESLLKINQYHLEKKRKCFAGANDLLASALGKLEEFFNSKSSHTKQTERLAFENKLRRVKTFLTHRAADYNKAHAEAKELLLNVSKLADDDPVKIESKYLNCLTLLYLHQFEECIGFIDANFTFDFNFLNAAAADSPQNKAIAEAQLIKVQCLKALGRIQEAIELATELVNLDNKFTYDASLEDGITRRQIERISQTDCESIVREPKKTGSLHLFSIKKIICNHVYLRFISKEI